MGAHYSDVRGFGGVANTRDTPVIIARLRMSNVPDLPGFARCQASISGKEGPVPALSRLDELSAGTPAIEGIFLVPGQSPGFSDQANKFPDGPI